MNLPSGELSRSLEITKEQAMEMKTMTFSELCRCEEICFEEKDILDLKGKCREKLYGCTSCRKEFLESEIISVTDISK